MRSGSRGLCGCGRRRGRTVARVRVAVPRRPRRSPAAPAVRGPHPRQRNVRAFGIDAAQIVGGCCCPRRRRRRRLGHERLRPLRQVPLATQLGRGAAPRRRTTRRVPHHAGGARKRPVRPARARTPSALRQWCTGQRLCVLAEWANTAAANDPASYVDTVHLNLAATRARAAFIAEVVAALLTGRPIPNPQPPPTPAIPPAETTTT